MRFENESDVCFVRFFSEEIEAFFNKVRIFAGTTSAWMLCPVTTTGAIAQAPTQLTVSSVNAPSSVVSPARMRSCRLSSSSRSCAPRTWHAVPLHTWMTVRPLGDKLNTL